MNPITTPLVAELNIVQVVTVMHANACESIFAPHLVTNATLESFVARLGKKLVAACLQMTG